MSSIILLICIVVIHSGGKTVDKGGGEGEGGTRKIENGN
jgi:hypothetical protein